MSNSPAPKGNIFLGTDLGFVTPTPTRPTNMVFDSCGILAPDLRKFLRGVISTGAEQFAGEFTGFCYFYSEIYSKLHTNA